MHVVIINLGVLHRSEKANVHQIPERGSKTILGAPPWTSVATMREECGLPTIQHRILARTSIAMVAYMRRWPAAPLTIQYCHAFQRPPAAGPDKDWVHAAADSARTLDVARVVRCDATPTYSSRTTSRWHLGPHRSLRSPPPSE
ncbi:hypothetical protein GWK47_038396 [Chionoecetes opilio]|uniref:Uncharacterized protein n=1 Tax=Chionoecetes opilio TaxID=41210 RepID=A0A8J4YCN4_CHIOP|nr:hypothetical protein GWK47_038396 [Chionoecetes opilio]